MLTQRPLPYSGRFSLFESIGFLEDWPPSAPQAGHGSRLHWAFHLDRTWEPADVVVEQTGTDVTATIDTDGPVDAAVQQVARILGLDVDASGFTPDGIADSIAGGLLRARPGLRPTSFWTPYEAAVWAVLSQRVSMVQASRLKLRMAQLLGIGSNGFHAFPPPVDLRAVDALDGVSQTKIDRLHAVAAAALDGVLDAVTLRELPRHEALDRLTSVPGIGPFSAELILVRGAGHPDVFPMAEQRLHGIMRSLYARPHASARELAEIAQAWKPYRSWVSFLFRSSGG